MTVTQAELLTPYTLGTRSGWRRVKFGEIAEAIADRIDNPSQAGVEYYVGLEHLDSGSLKIRRWGTPDDVEATKLRFKPGDIIFGKRRAYQRKVAVAEFEGICSAHAMVLRAREENIVKEFLPFFMQGEEFSQRAVAISEGSLSPTIKWKTLDEQEFVLQSMDEQRCIAEILRAADEMLVKWQSVQTSLDLTLAALREQVVCASSHPRRRLGNYLIDIVPGKSVVGMNTPAASGEVGVLKVSAVGRHGFVPDENKRLLDPDDFRSEFQVSAGDFLITRANTQELVGRVCLVPEDHSNLMLSDKTLRLDTAEHVVSQVFLLEALRSREARLQIEAAASGTGGAMKNISQHDIRNLLIPFPDIETQRAIACRIQEVTAAKQAVAAHLQRSEVTKKQLLQDLLASGESLLERTSYVQRS